MKWYIHKTQNGWIVTMEDLFTSSSVKQLYVFSDMRGVAAFLIKAAGEAPKRDAKGHFARAAK